MVGSSGSGSPDFGRCQLPLILRSMIIMAIQWKQVLLLIVLALSAYLLPLSTSGAWLFLAPLAAVGSFFAGRRVDSVVHGIIALAAGALAAGITLIFSTDVSVLTFALNLSTGVVLFVLLPWWAGRARRNALSFRAQERHHAAVQAGLRERARIAEAMHDQLGHDMALLALSTGGLQMTLDRESEAYQFAVRIRAQADQAVEHLHEIIEVLHDPNQNASLSPQEHSLERLIAQARSRGMQINYQVTGSDPAAQPGSLTGAVLHQVLQEALTNAAKYAPHHLVDVELDSSADPMTLRISNPLDGSPPPARSGATGLRTLRAALALHGGSLRVNRSDDSFEVVATLGRFQPDSGLPPEPGSGKASSRWLLVLVPVLAVAAMVLGLYFLQLATFRATALSPADFQQLTMGMTREEVAEHVQAKGLDQPLPVIDESRLPASGQCRYYAARTGVLDLGSEMFRLCFSDDVLISADHLYPAP
ncbi:hypothetical protein FQA45_01130 [Glutamicibacter halophytocola]|uniref:histidine kinase n=2 Tax=Glutamicibacter halophytocola TaxID=1933880 RepID=A0ABX5Y5E3_9MICC|nr:hypothetical protein FQA45_01130 [Glutamicibacter halophytocola]